MKRKKRMNISDHRFTLPLGALPGECGRLVNRDKKFTPLNMYYNYLYAFSTKSRISISFTEPLDVLPRDCGRGWLIGTKTFTPLRPYLELGENYSSVARGEIDICEEKNLNVRLVTLRQKDFTPQAFLVFG